MTKIIEVVADGRVTTETEEDAGGAVPASYFDARLIDAAAALGVAASNLGIFAEDFNRGTADYTTNTDGNGTASVTPANGGTITLDTTATSGRSVSLGTNAAVVPSTDNFVMGCRARLNVTNYSWGHLVTVCADPGYQSNYLMLSMDGSQLKLELDKPGSSGNFPTSWTPDTGWHDFVVTLTSSKAIVTVDGVEVLNRDRDETFASSLFEFPAKLGAHVENEGHSISESIEIDKLFLIAHMAV